MTIIKVILLYLENGDKINGSLIIGADVLTQLYEINYFRIL